MCENTQSNERDFFRWFVPLTIINEPELKVFETVFSGLKNANSV